VIVLHNGHTYVVYKDELDADLHSGEHAGRRVVCFGGYYNAYLVS